MNDEIGVVQPFDSFTKLYNILTWLGYSKPLKRPQSRVKCMLHEMYHHLALLIVFVYNVQHIMFVFLTMDNVEIFLDGLMIAIPHMNLLMKLICLRYGRSRLKNLQELLKGPIFGANSEKDEEYLTENKNFTNRLLRFMNIGIPFCCITWIFAPFAKKLKDYNTPVNTYVPFETTTWKGFTLGMLIEVSPVFWVGYGHITLDLVISTYYQQAQVQLKIIKYNLKHICDSFHDGNEDIKNFQFKDVVDTNIQNRFIHYVQRYEKVAWYTEEVNSVFNLAISSQFFTTSAAICLVVYKMSLTHSVPILLYFMVYFIVLQMQVFVYCYFGDLVEYESMSVVTAMYLGDWVSLSPRFRRQLLIAMMRWARPISPQVSAVVPLSLNTFITVVRAAYTMFTVLRSSQNLQ